MTTQVVMDEKIFTSMGLLSFNEKDDKFNDDDAWVVEEEDITGERNNREILITFF